MKSDYARAFAIVWRRENGSDQIVATDNPNDPGGYTRGGVALNRHPEITRAQLDAMTVPQFSDFYRQAYWTPNACDFVPWPACLVLFDAVVNSGGGGAEDFQRALGAKYNGHIDGSIGPMTLAAVTRFDPVALACRVSIERDNFYRKLSDFPQFGVGWLSRLYQNLFEAGAS